MLGRRAGWTTAPLKERAPICRLRKRAALRPAQMFFAVPSESVAVLGREGSGFEVGRDDRGSFDWT